MDYGDAVAFVIISAAITAALLFAMQNYSVPIIAQCAMLAISFSSLILLLTHKARKLKEDSQSAGEFAEKLKLISVQVHKAPTKKIMDYASNSCTDEKLKGTFSSTSILSRMGYPMHVAISKSHAGIERFSKILRLSQPSAPNYIHNVVLEYQNKKAEKDSVKASKMQRYATANMFISTIAPSFVIFGFIGDMVISQRSAGIMGLVLILNLLIPFVFTISNFAMLGRLIE